MAIPIAIARVGAGRAANGVGARDHAAGRTGRPKNGDISPIRSDAIGKSVAIRACMAHAEKGSATSMG